MNTSLAILTLSDIAILTALAFPIVALLFMILFAIEAINKKLGQMLKEEDEE